MVLSAQAQDVNGYIFSEASLSVIFIYVLKKGLVLKEEISSRKNAYIMLTPLNLTFI